MDERSSCNGSMQNRIILGSGKKARVQPGLEEWIVVLKMEEEEDWEGETASEAECKA